MVHKYDYLSFLNNVGITLQFKKNQGYNWLLEMFYTYELLGLSAIYLQIYAYRLNVALRWAKNEEKTYKQQVGQYGNC
jgi:hypothetical protein